jgi:hypothetical protein
LRVEMKNCETRMIFEDRKLGRRRDFTGNGQTAHFLQRDLSADSGRIAVRIKDKAHIRFSIKVKCERIRTL